MDMPPKDKLCHRTGFTQGCRALVVDGKCDRWKTLEGENPANGQPMLESNCIDDWPMVIALDQSRKLVKGFHGLQAAQESLRNEVITGKVRSAATEANLIAAGVPIARVSGYDGDPVSLLAHQPREN